MSVSSVIGQADIKLAPHLSAESLFRPNAIQTDSTVIIRMAKEDAQWFLLYFRNLG